MSGQRRKSRRLRQKMVHRTQPATDEEMERQAQLLASSEEDIETRLELESKMKNFHFFWRSESPFSQWHKSTYILDGVEYTCAEQGMMHGKALLFEDCTTARLILQAKSPSAMKALGRKVRGFKDKVWKKECEGIVYDNNMAKFRQNAYLFNALMGTLGKDLVEASPSDRIWGIGLNECQARETPPSEWPGHNLLGKVLTRVRDNLSIQYQSLLYKWQGVLGSVLVKLIFEYAGGHFPFLAQ